MAALPHDLRQILKQTSRSFYLTLQAVPGPIKLPIGLGYLLARASDTIADTSLVPESDRVTTLRSFRGRLRGESREPLDFSVFSPGQSKPAEKRLLRAINRILILLESMKNRTDQARIRRVVETIVTGQELDLERFSGSSSVVIKSLHTEADLDDYTFRVAGCVGEFWTDLCRVHLFPDHALDQAEFLQKGIQFGKGLQLVNILRDFPNDIAQGRCYIPSETLEREGLRPRDLSDPAVWGRLLPLYRLYLDRAFILLREGWRYTLMIPRSQVRLRLACSWPLLIGAKTLALLQDGPGTSDRPVKVSRRAVRAMICKSLCLYPFPGRWEKLFPGDPARIKSS